MAGDSSFDVVCKVDRHEVDNAVNQAAKEVSQRFDFRGAQARIAWAAQHVVEMEANTEERVKAVLDVFKDKLVKRGVSLKALDADEPRAAGKLYKISGTLQDGLTQEQARQVAKLVRDEGPKGIKVAVQGDELRISAKKKDDLQQVISLLKGRDFDFALQFVNYR